MRKTSPKLAARFALALALTTLLGAIKFSAPWILGGSVTLFSMVPIVAFSLAYGSKYGFRLGFCYGLLKLIMGGFNLACVSFISALVVILLDYLFAYGLIGIAAFFLPKNIPNRRKEEVAERRVLWFRIFPLVQPRETKNKTDVANIKILLDTPRKKVNFCIFFAFFLRFFAHFLAGVVVWSNLLVCESTWSGMFYYCAGYNLLYLVPEMLLTMLGMNVILGHIKFNSPTKEGSAAT